MKISLANKICFCLIFTILLECFILLLSSSAQISSNFSSASSPNPVGSGARASGMGGAFIAVADDATAASWNPAGLIQLETPEVSIATAYSQRTEDSSYEDFPDASGPQDFSSLDLNYFSYAYPFSFLSRNMILSLNYQHFYDFGKKFQYGSSDDTPPVTTKSELDFDRKGGLRAISPAYATQVTPNFSLGVTLNFWKDPIYNNEWKSTWEEKGKGSFNGLNYTYNIEIEDTYKFSGANFNLGFLLHLNHFISIGGVYKSPFTAELERSYNSTSTEYADQANPVVTEISFSSKEKLDMPMSYGIGIAIRWSDAFTVSFDLYRTEWDDYVLHTDDGQSISPITNLPVDESDIDATTQARLGCEYLFIREKTIIPLRAGIFYDPEPASEQPDDFFGFGIGSGIAYKSIIFDLAYQYRFAEDVRNSVVGSGKADQDVQQHTLYMSIIYHF
jgi:long-chain fatty acid transport protein